MLADIIPISQTSHKQKFIGIFIKRARKEEIFMRNQNVTDMVIMSMFLTIIIVLSAVPNLGFISLPFLPIVGGTIIHIPVLVACFYSGKRIGVMAGLFFGVSSWIVALTRAATPIEFVFRNPLVSVLPRVAFAFLSIYIFKLLKRKLSTKVSIAIASALGTIIHTLLVLGLIVAFGISAIADIYGVASIKNIWTLIQYTLIFNTIFETALAIILVTPIVYALRAMNHQSEDTHLWDE
jgi:uncharacterized membrane protein